jgi:hypothetical protein
MAEQDHHHHPGGADAEKRPGLQLLQQVLRESSGAVPAVDSV